MTNFLLDIVAPLIWPIVVSMGVVLSPIWIIIGVNRVFNIIRLIIFASALSAVVILFNFDLVYQRIITAAVYIAGIILIRLTYSMQLSDVDLSIMVALVFLAILIGIWL